MTFLYFISLFIILFGNSIASDNDAESLPARSPKQSRRSALPALTVERLEHLVHNIKGDDNRLFRWDATEHTAEVRRLGGCNRLDDAARVVMHKDAEHRAKVLALEFLTFCVTDSPHQRTRISELVDEGFHAAVVELVKKERHRLSSMASQLIYISSFTNSVNQQAFFDNGAVEALAEVILNPIAHSSQKMSAAAALQNMAASYCESTDDGRCYWTWNKESPDVVLDKSSSTVMSDGSEIRRAILKVPGLVKALIDLACTGPVGPMDLTPSRQHVFPGDNAVWGLDDKNPNVVAWAATGALKNLALEPSSKLQLESALPCMCSMRYSPDWLESSKSSMMIAHMRRGRDPCWFDPEDGTVCVDRNLLDKNGFTCAAYQDPTEEDCSNTDTIEGVTAQHACCECDGGYIGTIDPATLPHEKF